MNNNKLLLAVLFALCPIRYASSQWLEGFSHRVRIDVSASNVYGSGDLVDYPLLVQLSHPVLKSVLQGGVVYGLNGEDFSVTDSDGTTLLSFDIEYYRGLSGELTVWVKIPALSPVEDRFIYLYMGNPDARIRNRPSNVWNNAYVGVWHMSLDTEDATKNANHGKDSGTGNSTGKIGLAKIFDGGSDYVAVPYSESLNIQDNITIEAWVKFTGGEESYSGIFSKQGNYDFWYGKEHLMFYVGGYNYQLQNVMDNEKWYYLSATYDRSFMRIYIDGLEAGSVANNEQIGNDINTELTIGKLNQYLNSELNGELDEVRLSSQALGPNWIRTSYTNQNNPQAFSNPSDPEVNNNSPCKAIELNLNVSCDSSIYSNMSASASGIAMDNCAGTAETDLWFKIVVPPSGKLVASVDSNPLPSLPDPGTWLSRLGLAVYSGTCSNPVYDTCWIDEGFNDVIQMPELTLNGYTPGDTLFLRVWEYSNEEGLFKICVSTPETDEDPSITCPDDISTFTLPDSCSRYISLPLPLADDDIGVVSILNDFNTSADASGIYPPGQTIVEWTALDGSGNSASCTHSVLIEDSIAPSIECPEDMEEYVNDSCQFVVPDYTDLIQVTDNCDPEPQVTQTPPAGTTISGSGSNEEILLSALDSADNLSTCSFTITLLDNSPPRVLILNDTTVMAPAGTFQAHIDLPVPHFTDNCGIFSIENNFTSEAHASGTYPFGLTTVIYTVTDINGNISQFSQHITVETEEEPEQSLIIPEAFSPNEDGYNDRFRILGMEQYPDNELIVYNTNGIEVYRKTNYDNSWDGTPSGMLMNGEKLPTGSYYYVIYLKGIETVVKGCIYLRRE